MSENEEYERLRNAYQTHQAGAYFGIVSQNDEFHKAKDQMAKELKEFCLANGHDLEELQQFFRKHEPDMSGFYGS